MMIHLSVDQSVGLQLNLMVFSMDALFGRALSIKFLFFYSRILLT